MEISFSLGLLFVILFVVLVLIFLLIVNQENNRRRLDKIAEKIENNENLEIDASLSPEDNISSLPLLREDCFSYVPEVEIFIGDLNDASLSTTWVQDRINEGSLVENVDLTPVPIKSNNSSVMLNTSNFSAEVLHVEDLFILPRSNTISLLRVESPISSGGLTFPQKGLETDGGSNSSGDAFEIVFQNPVGIISFDCLNLEGSSTYPIVIRLWDKNNFMFRVETIETNFVGSLVFIGIRDPINRIKTMRIATGSDNGNQNNEWSIFNIALGNSYPYGACDVSRIVESDGSQIEVSYRKNDDNSLLNDQEIIENLLLDP